MKLCFDACSLEYSSLSTLAGLSYHICGKLEVAFKASPSSQHQHFTDEAQFLTGGLVVRSRIVSSVVWFPCESVVRLFVSAFSAVLAMVL